MTASGLRRHEVVAVEASQGERQQTTVDSTGRLGRVLVITALQQARQLRDSSAMRDINVGNWAYNRSRAFEYPNKLISGDCFRRFRRKGAPDPSQCGAPQFGINPFGCPRHLKQTLKMSPTLRLSEFGTALNVSQKLTKVRWASARLIFIAYISFSVVSVLGGFLSAPLMTWYFFGDWRFWRHWSAGLGLLPHAFRLLNLMLRDNRGFMFSVPLTAPPRSTPDSATTTLHSSWPHGGSCGACSNCCRAGGHACPLLDENLGLCRGHDSFYWRYFNCGRFPSVSAELDYYNCHKWVLSKRDSTRVQASPVFSAALINVIEKRSGTERVSLGKPR